MKRIIALLFILFLAGPAFAQDAPVETPPAAAEPAPLAPEPTLSERVSSVHAALMQAVIAYESGVEAQETASAREAIARANLDAAELGSAQVMQSRNAVRQALIDHLSGRR